MNPHYHPYGGGPELTPPHPPSPPDNGPYHHPRMHPANGHTIGPPSHGHPGGNPHDPSHPSCGGDPSGIMHQHQHVQQAGGGHGGGARACAGCGGKILERYYLAALDRYWHTSCLKCTYCAAMLGDIGTTCFTKAGMILCKQDYMRLFGNSGACSACGMTIPASDYVMKVGGPSAQQPTAPLHVFHIKCFACSKCMAPLVAGDRYYMLAGSLVCEQDWHKLLKSSTTTPAVRKGKVGRPRRSRD